MKEEQRDDTFLAAVRKTMDQGTTELDGVIAGRLAQARRCAVAQGERRQQRRWLWLAAPLVVSLVTALIVVVLFWRNGPGVSRPAGGETVADLEIITAAEAPEFYAELEFYQWLAEEKRHAS